MGTKLAISCRLVGERTEEKHMLRFAFLPLPRDSEVTPIFVPQTTLHPHSQGFLLPRSGPNCPLKIGEILPTT